MSPIEQLVTGIMETPHSGKTAAELRAQNIAENVFPDQAGMSLLEQPATPDSPNS